MNTIHSIIRTRVSPSVASIGLLICSVTWFIGFYAYYAGAGFNGDLSSTPKLSMLAVMLAPAVCFGWSMTVVGGRRQTGIPVFDRCALAVAFLPITFGTLLAISVTKAMFF